MIDLESAVKIRESLGVISMALVVVTHPQVKAGDRVRSLQAIGRAVAAIDHMLDVEEMTHAIH